MNDLVGWSHADLCTIAVKWLKRPNSNNGHGCHVAVSEVRSGWVGEVPDAIGFRQSGYAPSDGSIVVEVKVSRSDFLADKKKPHRIEGGLGNWRYFMCPEEMIEPDELPEGWGLLWVNKRGHVKPKAGFARALADSKNYNSHQEALSAYRLDSDWSGEQFILVKLCSRIGDAEELNQKMRGSWREQQRLAKRCNALNEEVRELKRQLWAAKRGESRDSRGICELTAGLDRLGKASGDRKSPSRPVSQGEC
ncbi:adenylosuccinate synthase [Vreelandella maris]|uniref:adenylosuccinate synthase n=1 Tax=Vreelandella maris TaxID=2729617 RepID=UPI0030EE591E